MARKKKVEEADQAPSRNQIYEGVISMLETAQEAVSLIPSSLEGLGVETRVDVENTLNALQALKEKVVFRDSKLTMRGL